MDNWTLSASVGKVGVIALVQEIQHDGPGTKVERNILPNCRPWIAVYLKFLQSSPLDFAHPYELASYRPPQPLSIRPQVSVTDLRKIVDVRDVVDLGVRRDHESLF